MRINELRAIEMLAKAIELGSLRRAAAALGVTPQAASQAVAQLERHLGVRLLHRTTRSISLTDEGQQLLDTTGPALAALDYALQQVRSAKDEIAGPLRIVGPRSSFAPILWPVLDEFCRMYPGVQPDVQLDDGIGNWVADRVDVGFRIGGQPEDGLIARPLLPVQLLVCAAPSYLERYGVPRTIEDLDSHRCSVFRHPATGQMFPWYLDVEGEIVARHFPSAVVTNDTEIEIQAALSGQVIAQPAVMAVVPLIRAGRLVPLLTQHLAAHLRLTLYYGSRKAQSSRVRQFIELAVARLADNPDLMLSADELEAFASKAPGARPRTAMPRPAKPRAAKSGAEKSKAGTTASAKPKARSRKA